MATLYFQEEIQNGSFTYLYTPPANVAGKLCRLYVSQVVCEKTGDTTFDSGFYIVSCNLPQPYGSKLSTSSTVHTIPNNVITFVSTFTHLNNDNPIFVQLRDGPQDLTFTVTDFVGAKPPAGIRLGMILHLTPVDRNAHYEQLLSYSTGPNVR